MDTEEQSSWPGVIITLFAISLLSFFLTWNRVPFERSLGYVEGRIAAVEDTGDDTVTWIRLQGDDGWYRISPPGIKISHADVRRKAQLSATAQLRYLPRGSRAGWAYEVSFDRVPYYTYAEHLASSDHAARWGQTLAAVTFVGALWCIPAFQQQTKDRAAAHEQDLKRLANMRTRIESARLDSPSARYYPRRPQPKEIR